MTVRIDHRKKTAANFIRRDYSCVVTFLTLAFTSEGANAPQVHLLWTNVIQSFDQSLNQFCVVKYKTCFKWENP